VRTALDDMEDYVQARIGGNAPAETSGRWIVAKFEHDSAKGSRNEWERPQKDLA
jgi:hypothetical protein